MPLVGVCRVACADSPRVRRGQEHHPGRVDRRQDDARQELRHRRAQQDAGDGCDVSRAEEQTAGKLALTPQTRSFPYILSKIRLQAKNTPYTGAIDVLTKIAKEKGISGWYQVRVHPSSRPQHSSDAGPRCRACKRRSQKQCSRRRCSSTSATTLRCVRPGDAEHVRRADDSASHPHRSGRASSWPRPRSRCHSTSTEQRWIQHEYHSLDLARGRRSL